VALLRDIALLGEDIGEWIIEDGEGPGFEMAAGRISYKSPWRFVVEAREAGASADGSEVDERGAGKGSGVLYRSREPDVDRPADRKEGQQPASGLLRVCAAEQSCFGRGEQHDFTAKGR